MSGNALDATASDLAAVILTETIVESAKSEKATDIPIEAIDKINPSILLGSMTTEDPVRLSKTKPTLILNDEQKNNLKKSYLLIKDRINLGLANSEISNHLFSNAINDSKNKQLNVHQENSYLISLNAVNTVKTREYLESGGEADSSSGDGAKSLKIADNINNQISRLNHAISGHSPAASINMGLALSKFWKNFKHMHTDGDIENKLSGMFNATSSNTASRMQKAAETKLDELKSGRERISDYARQEQVSTSDRYEAPVSTQSLTKDKQNEAVAKIDGNTETPDVSP